jgi:hypothetical protein
MHDNEVVHNSKVKLGNEVMHVSEVMHEREITHDDAVSHDNDVMNEHVVMHESEVMHGSVLGSRGGDNKRQRPDAHCQYKQTHDTTTNLHDATGKPKPKEVTLVLDACDLQVASVHEVEVTELELLDIVRVSFVNHRQTRTPADSMAMYMQLCDDKSRRTTPMRHLVENWCIKVWKEGVTDTSHFPRLIKSVYSTMPQGNSVRWARDQDDK